LIEATAKISAQTGRHASLLIDDLNLRTLQRRAGLTVADRSFESTGYGVLGIRVLRSAQNDQY
jgi:hypothetical protein